MKGTISTLTRAILSNEIYGASSYNF